MIEGIMPVGNLTTPVIGANVPLAQIAGVVAQIGPIHNRVALAPSGSDDDARIAAFTAAWPKSSRALPTTPHR